MAYDPPDSDAGGLRGSTNGSVRGGGASGPSDTCYRFPSAKTCSRAFDCVVVVKGGRRGRAGASSSISIRGCVIPRSKIHAEYPVLHVYIYIPGSGRSYLCRVLNTMIRVCSHIHDQADPVSTIAESKALLSFHERRLHNMHIQWKTERCSSKQLRFVANTLMQTEDALSTTCST